MSDVRHGTNLLTVPLPASPNFHKHWSYDIFTRYFSQARFAHPRKEEKRRSAKFLCQKYFRINSIFKKKKSQNNFFEKILKLFVWNFF